MSEIFLLQIGLQSVFVRFLTVCDFGSNWLGSWLMAFSVSQLTIFCRFHLYELVDSSGWQREEQLMLGGWVIGTSGLGLERHASVSLPIPDFSVRLLISRTQPAEAIGRCPSLPARAATDRAYFQALVEAVAARGRAEC